MRVTTVTSDSYHSSKIFVWSRKTLVPRIVYLFYRSENSNQWFLSFIKKFCKIEAMTGSLNCQLIYPSESGSPISNCFIYMSKNQNGSCHASKISIRTGILIWRIFSCSENCLLPFPILVIHSKYLQDRGVAGSWNCLLIYLIASNCHQNVRTSPHYSTESKDDENQENILPSQPFWNKAWAMHECLQAFQDYSFANHKQMILQYGRQSSCGDDVTFPVLVFAKSWTMFPQEHPPIYMRSCHSEK